MKCELDYYLDEEFMEMIFPIINTDNFKLMKTFKQHKNSNIYNHSILVAYNCYIRAKNNKMYDLDVLVRGALLHDYFLYDWRVTKDRKGFHGFNHPFVALKNAMVEYNLTSKEIDIIMNHMWPLTFFHIPHSREAWLVSMMDKLVAFAELRKKSHMMALNRITI